MFQPAAESGPPSNSPSSSEGLEEIAKKERERIAELLKNKGIRYGFYPRFTVAVKGQKVIAFLLVWLLARGYISSSC